jgi:hypothetical protein
MVTALLGRTAGASPWNIEPIVGVSTVFNTNPLLSEFDTRSEARIAALLDLPVRYDGDAVEFSVRPYGRLSDSQGYSTLASNYAHLDSAAQFTNELGSTTVQASLARDSSLYYAAHWSTELVWPEIPSPSPAIGPALSASAASWQWTPTG